MRSLKTWASSRPHQEGRVRALAHLRRHLAAGKLWYPSFSEGWISSADQRKRSASQNEMGLILAALHREWRGAADGDTGSVGGGGLFLGLARFRLARLAFAVAAALGVEVATEPAVAGGGGVGGVPDVHGLEVGAVGVGVADALDDGGLAVVEELFERAHLGVEADAVGVGAGELEGFVLADADAGAGLVVLGHAVGDDGVEPVVAAGELDDDEDVVFGHAGRGGEPHHGGDHGSGRVLKEGRGGGGRGGQDEAGAQEFTTGKGGGGGHGEIQKALVLGA